MEDGAVRIFKCFRNIRGYLDVIMVSTLMGFFAYLLVGTSLQKAVDRYFNGINAQGEAASAVAQSIKGDIEGLLAWVPACIVVLVTIIAIAVFCLARLRFRVRKSQNTLKNAIDAANIIIMILDRDGAVLELNKHAQELFDDVGARKQGNFLELLSQKDARKLIRRMDNHDTSGMNLHFELRLKTDTGYPHLYCSVQPVVSEDGDEHYELLAVDITDRAQKEIELKESHEELTAVYRKLAASEDALKAQLEKINKLAYTDQLTGLPNKISLMERFTGELEKNHECMALVIIDLDDFKLVNETYGHLTGDRVLVEVAKRLKQITSENMFLARLGADEFAILVWDFESKGFLPRLAHEIENRVDGYIYLEEANISISSSIGITFFPQDAQNFDELYKNAEMAMYKAKDKKCRYLFYRKELNDAVVERLNLINCLKGDLERDEFYINYQPQFDTRSGRIIGLEALLRWENRHLGNVPPSRFISVAEETRLIIPIGEYVLRSALSFLGKLRRMGHNELIMCINISIIQLMQKDFTDMVLDILKENRIPCEFLELEITESVMMESASVVLENINNLRRAGVRIALDDFGTGYSSLNYLMDLPINTLKTDKSFIDNIGHVKGNQLLVSTIMSIGRRLGLSTVAEGVEHPEQLDYLKRRKCERVQGFLLSKPLSQAEIVMLLGGAGPCMLQRTGTGES